MEDRYKFIIGWNMFVVQIRQQPVAAHEGVIRTGDVVAWLHEYEIGRHVGVFGELIEAGRDAGLDGTGFELVDVVLVSDELHGYLGGVYSYKLPRFARANSVAGRCVLWVWAGNTELESSNRALYLGQEAQDALR